MITAVLSAVATIACIYVFVCVPGAMLYALYYTMKEQREHEAGRANRERNRKELDKCDDLYYYD